MLLMGFPIPTSVDGEATQLHWQAIELPPLAQRPFPGFRLNETGLRNADRRTTLSSSRNIAWARSDNWSEANAHARGRFDEHLTCKRVLLIGAGALGSTLAEILVRGGVRNIVICDDEELEFGNLARHTLTTKELSADKASALVERLTNISVHVSATPIVAKFPSLNELQAGQIRDCDLIVNCTAEPDVSMAIERYTWSPRAYIVYLAFGWHVQRLYAVGAPASKFTRSALDYLLDPLRKEDLGNHAGEGLGREGPGCWHPVFPGRIDDVWTMAAMAAKELERLTIIEPDGVSGAMYSRTQTPISREYLGK